MQYGPFSDAASFAAVMKLQFALGLPGGVDGKFTVAVASALDAWLVARGGPSSKASIVVALAGLQASAPSATPFTADDFAAIADAYLAYKKATGGLGWWFKRNWPWVAGGVVLVGGAAGGGYWWYRSRKSRPVGELDGAFGGGDLGCPCALGHGGRTALYSFPSGRKRGHYRAATGRFHKH